MTEDILGKEIIIALELGAIVYKTKCKREFVWIIKFSVKLVSSKNYTVTFNNGQSELNNEHNWDLNLLALVANLFDFK